MTDESKTEAITRTAWREIPVPDLDEAMRFYGEASGWACEPFGEDYFAALAPDGEMIGGIFKASGDDLSNGVRITFATADLEAALQRVTAAGGTVLTPRTEIGGGMGWWAALHDPAGRWIGLSTDRALDG